MGETESEAILDTQTILHYTCNPANWGTLQL